MGIPTKRSANPKITSLNEGRYRLLRRIGKGGMASVYLAKDTNSGQRVAVKLPHRRLMVDRSFIKRFRLEGESLVQLRHPHILSVLETGLEHGRPYMVTRYLSAGTLGDRRFWRGKEVVPVVRSYFQPWLLPIADALDFIHQQGWIHRDIKPDNIFFDDEGTAVLGDFGIVKLASDAESNESGLTRTGTMIGTPEYMAPEVAMGLPASAASDQFSLALLIWELLCGHRAFAGRTPPQIVMEQKAGRLHGVATIGSRWGDEVTEVLQRALSFDPANRHPSCTRMAGEFSELMAASPRRAIAITMAALCPHCSSPLAIEPSLAGRMVVSNQCKKEVLIQLTGDPSPSHSELLPLDEIEDNKADDAEQSTMSQPTVAGTDLDATLAVQREQRPSCPHCGIALSEVGGGAEEIRCPSCRETVTMSTDRSATTSKQAVASDTNGTRSQTSKRLVAFVLTAALVACIGWMGFSGYRTDTFIAVEASEQSDDPPKTVSDLSGPNSGAELGGAELITPDNPTIRTGEPWQIAIRTRGLLSEHMRFRLADETPAGATIDQVTGVLAWNPSYDQGDQRHRLDIELVNTPPATNQPTANQPVSLVDVTTLIVSVIQVNHPPIIEFRNDGPYQGEPGQALRVPLDASDPEGQTLDYRIEPSVENCEIREDAFHWLVPESPMPEVTHFVIAVSDGETTVKRMLSVAIASESATSNAMADADRTQKASDSETVPTPDASPPDVPAPPTLDEIFATQQHYQCEWVDGGWTMYDSLHIGERQESGDYQATIFRSGSTSRARARHQIAPRAMAIQVQAKVSPTRAGPNDRSLRMLASWEDPFLTSVRIDLHKAIKNPFNFTMEMESFHLQIQPNGWISNAKQKWKPLQQAKIQAQMRGWFLPGARIPFTQYEEKYAGKLVVEKVNWPIFDGTLAYQQVRPDSRLRTKNASLFSLAITGRMNPDGSLILLRKVDSGAGSQAAIPRLQKPLYLRPTGNGFASDDFQLKTDS